tara:strand:- start:234 stop:743 length:510 start_codon:yes stop_codon:yes gene_type:complete
MDQYIYISGLFLILITIGGNFLAETFNCQTRELLKYNKYAKHFFLLFLIFFMITFTDTTSELSPFSKIKSSIIVWLSFLVCTKLHVFYSVSIFIILFILLGIIEFKKYYKKDEKNNKQIIDTLDNSMYVIDLVLLGVIIIGTLQYYFNLKKEKKTFKLFKFLFMIKKCK